MKITIVGSGNVAEIFSAAICGISGLELSEICARNSVRGKHLAASAGCRWVGEPERVSAADIYLIAVKDSAVEEVSARLAAAEGSVVAHMAGGVPMESIRSTTLHHGVMYPLQTFSAGHHTELSSVPMLVEGSTDHARRTIMTLAESLSERVLEADSTQRAIIHAAGAIACNFTNHLLHISSQLLNSLGIPFSILEPLVAETVRKAFAASDPALVQTGPAVRNDTRTISKHLTILEDLSEERYSEIYKLLSNSIWETSKKI